MAAASTYVLALAIAIACFSSAMGAKSVGFCIFCLSEGSACNKGNETTLPTMDCSTFNHTGPFPKSMTDGLHPTSVKIAEALQSNISSYMDEALKKSTPVKMVCLKYTVDIDGLKKPLVIKTCAPDKFLDQDICDVGDKVVDVFNADSDGCSTCSKNYCNGASGFTHHTFMIFSFLVPLMYKFFA